MGHSRTREISFPRSNIPPFVSPDYRDSHGALLVYDITDRSSFDRVQLWVKELRKMLGPEIVLVIVGNKSDLERQRVVTVEEADKYAALVGAKHFVVSAKLNKNVNEMFVYLAQKMLEIPPRDPDAARRGILAPALPQQKKDDGCCS
eukprot:TRINITY_DN298_c0_g1_i3.p1 TRINITY_DN298_c0_g1~~TRINITY_DN298_c0_g1_i3.p1  ORF type:complete len:147 (-),score=24.24 TRINITY_DN298_c0_g1_i3:88-528(-)